MTKLAAAEIAGLDPYKFMAVIGKRVIHPGGRDSTESHLGQVAITDTTPVLDVGCGVATTAVEIARRFGARASPPSTSARHEPESHRIGLDHMDNRTSSDVPRKPR